MWTDRIHDLQIKNNFITGTNLQNKATNNCTPVSTVLMKKSFSRAAKKIVHLCDREIVPRTKCAAQENVGDQLVLGNDGNYFRGRGCTGGHFNRVH